MTHALDKFKNGRDPRNFHEAKEYYALTLKQWKFCMAYTGPAECVGYKAAAMTYGKADGLSTEGGSMDYKSAVSIGQQNLQKRNIQACIQDILGVTVMSPNEVMHRISKMASANISDILVVDPITGESKLDLKKAQSRGATYLIKRLNFDSYGNLKSVELHDAYAALTKMGQHYKLFDRRREEIPDARDMARELLEELRSKHEDLPDNVLIDKVVARFSAQGVTASDLIDAPDMNN